MVTEFLKYPKIKANIISDFDARALLIAPAKEYPIYKNIGINVKPTTIILSKIRFLFFFHPWSNKEAFSGCCEFFTFASNFFFSIIKIWKNMSASIRAVTAPKI